MFVAGWCQACYMFARDHDLEECRGCGRNEPARNNYCRLCWHQAREDGLASGKTGPAATASHFLAAQDGHHQLFFADMMVRRGAATTTAKGYGQRGRPRTPPPPPAVRPKAAWIQPFLFNDVVRDYTRFDADQHDSADDNPWLAWGRHVAYGLLEARGWSRRIRIEVDRALTIVLSGHVDGDVVRYTELFAGLRHLDMTVERTADVLAAMEILLDDRRDSFEDWLAGKLDGLAPGLAAETERWARLLRDGGPRSRPRVVGTVWQYMAGARPLLLAWSQHHDHLREITREEVLAALKPLHGADRQDALLALRSLFGWAKRTGVVFRDPTSRIKVGERVARIITPLSTQQVDAGVEAATTPAERLILALAAVHAARSAQIRRLQLADVDLGNRRLTIDGRTRPLDDLTLRLLNEWLDYRRRRWPNTANPHLIINQMSAMKTTPVSTLPSRRTLRGRGVTIEALRIDRQLEEAITVGPDPLHLAEVFGLSEKTAIRYADTAKTLLPQAAENTP